jgi:hypothetical protein
LCGHMFSFHLGKCREAQLLYYMIENTLPKWPPTAPQLLSIFNVWSNLLYSTYCRRVFPHQVTCYQNFLLQGPGSQNNWVGQPFFCSLCIWLIFRVGYSKTKQLLTGSGCRHLALVSNCSTFWMGEIHFLATIPGGCWTS